MSRVIAVLLIAASAGCASQPQVGLPPPDDLSTVEGPQPEAATVAADVAMFAERVRQVIAVVVADSLSPDYRTGEQLAARFKSAGLPGVMDFLVNVDVDDLPRAIAFYQSAFGLRLGRRLGSAGVELLGGPTPLYLLAKAAGTAATATQRRSYQRHWTPLHLDFVVDDIESAVQRAVAAGAVLESPISTHEWGRLAVMADPFGNGYCFVQFVGRGYDAIAN